MPSEQLIQAVMARFARFSPQKRDNLLTALLAHKVSKEVDGVSLVMDPEFAAVLKPILDDENESLREALTEALLRLSKQDEQPKKKKWGIFGR